jgi:diadenosine tetraphosphate (Ap4A) HIT family hydrolase
MDDFEKYKIKDYKYWGVYLHENQEYLGRCVIYCKRENALDLAEATKEEQDELFVILKSLKDALERCFQSDWMNYAFLGNVLRHLHGHVIPRYSGDREFEGIMFKDERWGQNYKTNADFKTPEDLMQKIKNKIAESL